MKIISNSVKDTLSLGKLIARHLKAGDVICLKGDLGSGKTVLTKGIAAGLGINASKVTSPSFILIRQHQEGRIPLYHFDLYRLKEAAQVIALGYEEYIYGSGIAVIEWAEKLEYLMPNEYFMVKLSCSGASKRRLELSASGKRYKELLKKIHEDTSY